jgi:cell division protein FtsQ
MRDEPAAPPTLIRPDLADRQVSRLPARLYAARRRSRDRWRRLSVTVTVTLAVLALIGYVIVWHTSLFAVTAVRVVGAHAVSAQQIVAAAAVRPGTALAAVDTGAAAARVDSLVRIASTQVTLSWPHTVVVTVTERTAAALIPQAGGYQLVDGSGVIFGTVPAAVAGLPVIRVSASADVRRQVVPGALAALGALPATLEHQVVGISASSDYDITLTLSGGSTVNWGGGDQAAEKARDLAAMVRLGKAGHFDVSAPNAPAMS